MTENKWFNDFRGYKRFDSYFDDYMQLWVVSDNENDNMLYPCISENMTNEFIKLLNELNDENQVLREQYADDCNEANSMTVKISELIEEKEQLKQSYNEFEDECQSTLNAMNRKQNDLYRKIFKLNDENEQLRKENDMFSCELSVSANKEISRNCRIAELEEENEQLKQKIKKLEAQLYKVEDGVCDICNNMYLVQQGRYFVSKCKKGHDECSKMDLDYCDDFELKDGDV